MCAADARFHLRRATNEDAAGILGCLAAAFEPYRAQYSPEGFRDTVLTVETVSDRLRQMTVLVAVDENGAVIGTIGGGVVEHKNQPKEGHIRGMGVLPEWQGSGLATVLLRGIEGELARQGRARVTLDTTAPLVRAIAFYQRNGYRASGKVGDFFGMPLYEYVKELK